MFPEWVEQAFLSQMENNTGEPQLEQMVSCEPASVRTERAEPPSSEAASLRRILVNLLGESGRWGGVDEREPLWQITVLKRDEHEQK